MNRRLFFGTVIGAVVGAKLPAAQRVYGSTGGAHIGSFTGAPRYGPTPELTEWVELPLGPLDRAMRDVEALRVSMHEIESFDYVRVQYAYGPRETSRHILITTDWPEDAIDLNQARKLTSDA
jgi:hypothetical protein